jgi:outer membrane protein assembly factor BamB
MPRTAWRYGEARGRSPLAAFLGNSVFSTTPIKSTLFRVDFEKEKPFPTDWVQVTEKEAKEGLVYSTAKMLQSGGKWTVNSDDSPTRPNRAVLVAGNRLLVATHNGNLIVYNAENGQKLGSQKIDGIAWDGLAAARGKLYVSTRDGMLLCLGTK